MHFRRSTDVPLTSFWMAGFDGADHINSSGVALSMTELTQHDSHVDDDYRRLADLKFAPFAKARAGAPSSETGVTISHRCRRASRGQRGSVCNAMDAAFFRLAGRRRSIVCPLRGPLCALCEGGCGISCGLCARRPIYTPINEISFISWAIGHSGHINAGNDHLKHRKGELRRQFVRAALAACDAIRSVDPRARFMHTDPLMHVVRRDATAISHR